MTSTEIARRRDRIVSLLSSYGELSAGALADMLSVTVQTIRADLRTLDEARLIRRRHGSAVLNEERSTGENIAYQPRRLMSQGEKDRIGAAVARLIPDGASVALGTGTTVEAVARALVGHRDLRVATNSIHAALALRMAPGIEITLAGGAIRLRDLDFIGAEATDFFAGQQVDHAVFSVGGLSETGDLLDFNMDEIRARKAICAAARSRILVFDQDKIGREARFRWGAVAEVEVAVTGAELPETVSPLQRLIRV